MEHTISVLKETMDKVISFEKSLREQRMSLDADVAQVPASYTYNLINEDFTADLSPITLSTRGWDPTMPHPKKKRNKILGLSMSALGALKTGKKKTLSKSSRAGSSGALASISQLFIFNTKVRAKILHSAGNFSTTTKFQWYVFLCSSNMEYKNNILPVNTCIYSSAQISFFQIIHVI